MENKTVTMAHGAGGKQTSELIDQVFKAHFANHDLTADDAAVRTQTVLYTLRREKSTTFFNFFQTFFDHIFRPVFY